MHLIATIIAKNESANISRAIRSAVEFGCVDVIVIDTGSTDGTREVAEAACAPLPAILHFHDRPWRGFAAARNDGIWEARKLAARPAETMALIIDADEHLDGPLSREFDLNAPCLWLQEHCGAVSYVRPRLLRLDHNWICVGRVHEYWTAPGQTGKGEILDGLLMLSHGQETRSGRDKFIRYMELLLDDERDGIDPTRTSYYIAQTHAILGDNQAAYDEATRRIGLGGWDQETYAAHLCRIDAAWRLDARIAESAAREAVAWRPERPEAGYRLARILRLAGRFSECIDVAAQTLLDFDRWQTKDTLFLEPDVPQFSLHEEIAIAAWYCGRAAEGGQAALYLSQNENATEAQRARGAELLTFYAVT